MKKIIYFLFVLFSVASFAQKDAVWDYPIKPGSEEWKKFESNAEMVNACQIPEKVLSVLSTDELADICLEYPMLYDVFAFNDLNDGLKKLFSDFNGMRSLFSRKDATQVLLERYSRKIDNFSILKGKVAEIDKGEFVVSVSILEILLCKLETPILESKIVLQRMVECYESKLQYADYFKGFGLQTNFYARGNEILKIDGSKIENFSQKVNNAALVSGMADSETCALIDKLSYQLIKN